MTDLGLSGGSENAEFRCLSDGADSQDAVNHLSCFPIQTLLFRVLPFL